MDSKVNEYIIIIEYIMKRYAVLKLCEPFGKIASLDYMFHLHGPKKGQPRGYCFIEYENKKDSLKAISALHGKRMKGRNLVVSTANKNNKMLEELNKQKSNQQKPSAFNLIRNQKMTTTSTTDAKIQAIEEKLAALKKKPSTTTTATASSSTAKDSASSSSTHRFKPY
ncbi:hypothetical protein BJ944DRAFT_290054 [Cunninghamella echinulata]|nr:hypothetical protein BJ944DRAFT_290054 [Cunninghamella echinulata]